MVSSFHLEIYLQTKNCILSLLYLIENFIKNILFIKNKFSWFHFSSQRCVIPKYVRSLLEVHIRFFHSHSESRTSSAFPKIFRKSQIIKKIWEYFIFNHNYIINLKSPIWCILRYCTHLQNLINTHRWFHINFHRITSS